MLQITSVSYQETYKKEAIDRLRQDDARRSRLTCLPPLFQTFTGSFHIEEKHLINNSN